MEATTMIESRLTLKLAMNHMFGVSEETDDQAVRDLVQRAVNLLEAADALIVKGSTLSNELVKHPADVEQGVQQTFTSNANSCTVSLDTHGMQS
jgi:hypothetical protein